MYICRKVGRYIEIYLDLGMSELMILSDQTVDNGLTRWTERQADGISMMSPCTLNRQRRTNNKTAVFLENAPYFSRPGLDGRLRFNTTVLETCAASKIISFGFILPLYFVVGAVL